MRKEEDFTDGFEAMGRSLKRTLVSMVLGGIVGIAGGIFVGEKINDYFEILKQAPSVIQYGVDGLCSVSCGIIGGAVAGTASHMYAIYRTMQN